MIFRTQTCPNRKEDGKLPDSPDETVLTFRRSLQTVFGVQAKQKSVFDLTTEDESDAEADMSKIANPESIDLFASYYEKGHHSSPNKSNSASPKQQMPQSESEGDEVLIFDDGNAQRYEDDFHPYEEINNNESQVNDVEHVSTPSSNNEISELISSSSTNNTSGSRSLHRVTKCSCLQNKNRHTERKKITSLDHR